MRAILSRKWGAEVACVLHAENENADGQEEFCAGDELRQRIPLTH